MLCSCDSAIATYPDLFVRILSLSHTHTQSTHPPLYLPTSQVGEHAVLLRQRYSDLPRPVQRLPERPLLPDGGGAQGLLC